eukprot:SAG11_NODE_1266_length_5342_cov_4.156369_7_plen_90_part_00
MYFVIAQATLLIIIHVTKYVTSDSDWEEGVVKSARGHHLWSVEFEDGTTADVASRQLQICKKNILKTLLLAKRVVTVVSFASSKFTHRY